MWSWGLLFFSLLASLIHGFFIGRMRRVIKWSAQNIPKNNSLPGVSVIICAKNEAKRLETLIPKILNQNYPEFELLIVDDHSRDNTAQVLKFWQKKDPRVRSIPFIEPMTKAMGKKAALSHGIDLASHDILLLTDADCIPSSEQWIELMTAPLLSNKSVVLGYGGYHKRPGVLNALIRFETTLTAGLFLGQAIAGQPYMGVGRNLAYRKDFFRAQNGFKSHEHIASGDDDLLINHGATANNSAVIIDPKAYTWSEPKQSWKSLFRQKRRHQTTAHFYRNSSKLFLSLYAGSILIFYFCALILGISLSASAVVFQILISLIVLRSALLMSRLNPIFRQFHTADLVLWIPLLEPLFICWQLIIFVRNRISKPTHWN